MLIFGKIIDFIIGKASFEITLRDPRELSVLNYLRKTGFYDCRMTGGKLVLSCGCGDVKTITARLSEMGIDYHLRLYGLVPLLRRVFRRCGIPCAVAACFLLHAAASSVVWRIDISGNETISEKEVRDRLYAFGVYEGCRKSSIDIRRLSMDYLLADDRVSFMHLNLNGTTAHVKISERTDPPKRETDKKEVCNIVAKCDGIISRIDVYSGSAAVKNGQLVTKGQLLISSFFETRMSGYLLRRAKGTVFAETSPTFEMTVPKTAFRANTAREETKRSLHMLSAALPLDFGSLRCRGKIAKRETEIKHLSLFGLLPLPAFFVTERYTFSEITPYERTIDEAQALFEKKYAAWRASFSESAEIISEEKSVQETDDMYHFLVRLSCVENIGVDKPFEIREN